MRSVLDTTFRSLRVRNYRLFATGQLVKLVGVWMMFTAQDWLVLDLSGNSPAALGAVVSLQFVPVLLLTLYAGKLADRFDKRHLLIAANAAFALTAIAFAVLVASGHVRLWHVFLFAGLLGIANAVETPYGKPLSPNWSSCHCCRTRWHSRRPPSTPPGSAARRWPVWRSRSSPPGRSS